MANRSLNDDFNLSNENIANPFSVSYPSQTPVFNSLKPQVLERPSYNDVSYIIVYLFRKSLSLYCILCLFTKQTATLKVMIVIIRISVS